MVDAKAQIIKTREFGRWVVLFEVFAYTGERRNLLRNTAGGRLATSKTKKLTKPLKVRYDNGSYTIEEQAGDRGGGRARRARSAQIITGIPRGRRAV